jgi:hypothetical protein
MKVGDMIKLRDGTIGLVIKVRVARNQGASYFIIHTGEAFFPDCQHLEGWQAV